MVVLHSLHVAKSTAFGPTVVSVLSPNTSSPQRVWGTWSPVFRKAMSRRVATHTQCHSKTPSKCVCNADGVPENGPLSTSRLPTFLLLLFYALPQARGYRTVFHNSTTILSCAFWTALLAIHQCCKSMGMDNSHGPCCHVPCQLAKIDGLLFRWATPTCLAQG